MMIQSNNVATISWQDIFKEIKILDGYIAEYGRIGSIFNVEYLGVTDDVSGKEFAKRYDNDIESILSRLFILSDELSRRKQLIGVLGQVL